MRGEVSTPEGGKDKDAPLTAEPLIIELPEHYYVDTDRKKDALGNVRM